jgi:predicted ArsR family transcriptional regulator
MNEYIKYVIKGKEVMKNRNEKRRRGRKPKHIDFNFGNRSFTVNNVCDRSGLTKAAVNNRLKQMVIADKARVLGTKKGEGRGRPQKVYCLTDTADVQKTRAQDFAPYALVVFFDIEKVALAHEGNGGIAVSEID